MGRNSVSGTVAQSGEHSLCKLKVMDSSLHFVFSLPITSLRKYLYVRKLTVHGEQINTLLIPCIVKKF